MGASMVHVLGQYVAWKFQIYELYEYILFILELKNFSVKSISD